MIILIFIHLPFHLWGIPNPWSKAVGSVYASLSIIFFLSIQVNQTMTILNPVHIQRPIVLGCHRPEVYLILLEQTLCVIAAKSYEGVREIVFLFSL